MRGEPILCKHCGVQCGIYYEAQIIGPPENCYPAESDGDYLDGKKGEYCSQECLDAEEHCEEDEE